MVCNSRAGGIEREDVCSGRVGDVFEIGKRAIGSSRSPRQRHRHAVPREHEVGGVDAKERNVGVDPDR